MDATKLGVVGITLIAVFALVVGLVGVLAGSDPDTKKTALQVCLLAGTAISTIGGWLGGYVAGKATKDQTPPSNFTATIKE